MYLSQRRAKSARQKRIPKKEGRKCNRYRMKERDRNRKRDFSAKRKRIMKEMACESQVETSLVQNVCFAIQ